MNNKVRVRFAPSPTGDPHIGSLRTALFNWLFAKHYDGKFILRLEDTDRKRLITDSADKIYRALDWLGIIPDEGPNHGGDFGPYMQSQRTEIYKNYSDALIDNKKAFYCFCSSERLNELRQTQENTKQPTRYDGRCASMSAEEVKNNLIRKEPAVIRLKIPEKGTTKINDILRGKVIVNNDEIDHQVLIKSDGWPTYHLASVIDDHLMEISHVIRAEEWLPSTPKHVILYQAFGWSVPSFIHLSMIVGSDRSKLSKRHGATSVNEYINIGYEPVAIRSFLALLGWNPGTNQEIFNDDELIKQFSEKGFNKSAAVFDVKKLTYHQIQN
ncbi:glutamate--tRNA ligase [Patescibacteria group bacterium]